MITEDYDHRWEPLAEVHFTVDDDLNDENYIYCLCSRVFIRDGVQLYKFADKEEGSESEVEVQRDSKIEEVDDQSHVHFSVDTSYKVKCEKDEGASCYCSASHTDNYCSTDEHDPAQAHGSILNALQPSDSGADLTYQESHSDFHNDKPEKMDQDIQNLVEFEENYKSESKWETFWSVNGERIIWASWIKKYSDYINPAYLEENNDLTMEDANLPKDNLADQIYSIKELNLIQKEDDDSLRERKFSYDSKVNPYKKSKVTNIQTEKSEKYKDDNWIPIGRRRSCSEHDRMLSPRTLAGTDSMTNVTKITLSSCDVTSSHVTSISTPTDDYSVSSSTSDDHSNDQTRIANVDENVEFPIEEMDTDQYWQFLWKQHFGEQYALHYGNYVASQTKTIPTIDLNINNKVEVAKDAAFKEKSEIEYENSDGNSQEMPTVIEVQSQVAKIKLEEKKPKKKNKKTAKSIHSVGLLLQSLLKEEIKTEEIVETEDKSINKKEEIAPDVADTESNMDTANAELATSYDNFIHNNYNNDGSDDPPEDKPVTLKRSHEADVEEVASQKIKTTFDMMGLCLHPDTMLKGQLVYRKRYVRPPRMRSKKMMPRKTYFDDDGNPSQVNEAEESNEERGMQTDEDCPGVNSEREKEPDESPYDVPNLSSDDLDANSNKDFLEDAKQASLPDLDTSFSDCKSTGEEVALETVGCADGNTKRRRRKRRRSAHHRAPPELVAPHMIKYWRKRHSLFHRFDSGIRLDVESWFSVTPERVARHVALRVRSDLLLDAFCGAGGNAIQCAFTCQRVIAIDIDPVKISLARHNAEVYGVADRIEFIVGDFFQLAPYLKADVVFLSPPWGGPKYSENTQYDLETLLEPRPGSELMAAAEQISPNIALYVPRNSRSEQLVSYAKNSGAVEIEQNFLGRRFVALTAYYGELVNY